MRAETLPREGHEPFLGFQLPYHDPAQSRDVVGVQALRLPFLSSLHDLWENKLVGTDLVPYSNFIGCLSLKKSSLGNSVSEGGCWML